MATPQKIAEVIMLFRAAGLNNGPVTEEAVEACCEAWLLTLDDISDHDLTEAARAWMRIPQRGRWWPTPADLLECSPAVQAATRQIEAAKADDGSRWWPRVLRAVGSIGRSTQDWEPKLLRALGNPQEGPAIVAGVKAVGWRAIADSDHDAQRAGMGRTFQAAYQRALQGAEMLALPGNVYPFPVKAIGVR